MDDNEINRVVAREMLEAAGHTVSVAADGQAGVLLANQTKFDVILMDISMPVLDGKEAARLIKAGNGLSANTPIIALTAHAMPEDQASFADAGIFTTLTKPLSRQDLDDALNNIGHAANPTATAQDTIENDFKTSSTYANLKTQFLTELDAFCIDLQVGDITLADIGKRAHHAAGSAATFQIDHVADYLRDLAVAARAADNVKIDAASAAFIQAWQTERYSFLDERADQS